MFLKYLEPIFRPWRKMRNSVVRVKNTKGRFQAETNRVKRFGQVAKSETNKAKGHMQNAQGHMQNAQGQAQQVQGQMPQGQMPQGQMPQGQMPQGQMPQGQMPQGQMPPMQGMPQGQMPQGQMPMQGMPQGAPGMINPNPPIKTVGFFRRRKICTQCNAELDKTWDSCPYCAQAAASQQQASQKSAPAKTQAFMLDNSGGGSVQLLGWLVPLEGPLRGELYTLAPHSVIGTEPTCQVVLVDQYMSSQHAEIKAEGGVWILRDLGSTNGTYVNDKRIDQHELVDNDFVKFGGSMVKFKSL